MAVGYGWDYFVNGTLVTIKLTTGEEIIGEYNSGGVDYLYLYRPMLVVRETTNPTLYTTMQWLVSGQMGGTWYLINQSQIVGITQTRLNPPDPGPPIL